MSYNHLTEFLLSKVEFNQVTAILDIGCGYGHQLIRLGELVE